MDDAFFMLFVSLFGSPRCAVVEEVGIEPTVPKMAANLQSAALPLAHLLRGVLV